MYKEIFKNERQTQEKRHEQKFTIKEKNSSNISKNAQTHPLLAK